MIILDLKDVRPLYEQVVERFKHLILCGVLKEDEKIPSVRNLAMDLSINPNTIQRAYTELEREGFIYSVKGRGNFVSSVSKLRQYRHEELRNQLTSLVKEAESIGLTREKLIEHISTIPMGKYDVGNN